jgi:excisionase family DNA binding protein
MIPLLIKSPEAARVLGISTRTLWDLSHRRGEIPVVRIGRAVRYNFADLRAWVERQRRLDGAAPAAPPQGAAG